jgi:hypothetical protein
MYVPNILATRLSCHTSILFWRRPAVISESGKHRILFLIPFLTNQVNIGLTVFFLLIPLLTNQVNIGLTGFFNGKYRIFLL